MTIETYQELFHYTIFPVFAISHQGELIYKNLSCGKHLPGVNKKIRTKSYFYPAVPTGTAVVKLMNGQSYHTALALEDEGNIVILCFSRLQYEDGVIIAEQCLQRFGRTLASFLASLRSGFSLNNPKKLFSNDAERMYTELLCSLRSEVGLYPTEHYSLKKAIVPLFEKLQDVFSGLGYRVSAGIAENFPEYLLVNFSFNDLIFLLGRLVYLQLKLSANKTVDIRLSCDIAHNCHKFVLTTDTKLSSFPDKNEDLAEWLSVLAPECAAEFSFMRESGFLTWEYVSVYLDKFGTLTLTYSIPYISPDTVYVRSNDLSDILFAGALENMLYSIFTKIKDNGAFC